MRYGEIRRNFYATLHSLQLQVESQRNFVSRIFKKTARIALIAVTDNTFLMEPKNYYQEFFNAEEGTMVYHTDNEEFVIHIRKDPLVRVRRI